ncbi:MAG TPA: hypothetical protein VLV89_01285 [Candidatus Acidoferrum sp.]|nr:hypothetical protein [Candidatus Acidoferrum sp.]
MRHVVLTGWLCACAFAMACGSPANNSGGAQKTADASAPPDDIVEVAHGALGRDAEALAWGDLPGDGRKQVLAVNRTGKAEGTPGEEFMFTRMTVAENVSGSWSEVLLCDEHLKNEKGYLIGSPGEAISKWKMSFVKDPSKGLVMTITPMGEGSDAKGKTLHVRWNPAVMRYQAFDPATDKFTGEVASVEIIQRPLR